MFESRALQWNDPTVAKLIRESYVGVAWSGKKADGNGQCLLRHDGSTLAENYYPVFALQKGIEAWAKLPAKDRKLDPKKLPPWKGYIARFLEEPVAPPKGGLILQTYVRG